MFYRKNDVSQFSATGLCSLVYSSQNCPKYPSAPGNPERTRRVLRMVEQMDTEGFGNCSNYAECEAVCPKGISIENIAIMWREYLLAALKTGRSVVD